MDLVPMAIQGLSVITDGGLHGYICYGDRLLSQTSISLNPRGENYEHRVMPTDNVWRHIQYHGPR